MSSEELPLYLFLSPTLLIQQLSGRQGADWRKEKAPLNPSPNPQQALKHMQSGGPAAALSLSYSEPFLFFLFFSFPTAAATVETSRCTGGAARGTGHVCPAVCTLRLGEAVHAAAASTPCASWEVFPPLVRLTGCCLVDGNAFLTTLSRAVSPLSKKAER